MTVAPPPTPAAAPDPDATTTQAQPPAAPSWPTRTWPQVDPAVAAPQEPRRPPAGAYLAPSAVLGAVDRASRASAAADVAETARPQATTGDREAPTSHVSLVDSIDALGITADMPRRLIAIGAGVAALGFVLPWVNGLSGFIADYTSRWGMAGPGHWIVVAVLAAVVLLANTGGIAERLPVAVPAVALAALLVGLVWPYLFGGGSGAVGVWTVLAGSIVLAAGGALGTRRHEGTEPAV